MENKRGDGSPPPTPEEYLGRQVARLRKKRGLTQAELAERLGTYGHRMHQVTVAKLETGQRPTRVNEAVALSEILEVPVSALIPDRGVLGEPGEDPRRLGDYLSAAETALEMLKAEIEPHRERANFAAQNVKLLEREESRLRERIYMLKAEIEKTRG